MAASVWQLARYRALWLSLLLVAATLTVGVTRAFEATLEQVASLALFIPMLIGAAAMPALRPPPPAYAPWRSARCAARTC
ncbi:hypothetical protein LUW77_27245 [Streptomyces radiopugnans]|nr:hypothetical protein LUW77_27245 [Streptomyces radiopugnans]